MKPRAADGLRIISTGDRLYSGQASVLQYLGANDAPTGEYVLEAQGRWDSILDTSAFPPVDGGLQKTPAVVAMNSIVVTDSTRTKLEIYDLNGVDQFTSEPPGGRVEDEWQDGSGQLDNAYFHLQSVDAIMKAGSYDSFVPVSFDMGRTWYQAYVPRNPNAPVPPNTNAPSLTPIYSYQRGQTIYVYDPGVPVAPPPPDNGNEFLRKVSSWTPHFFT